MSPLILMNPNRKIDEINEICDKLKIILQSFMFKWFVAWHNSFNHKCEYLWKTLNFPPWSFKFFCVTKWFSGFLKCRNSLIKWKNIFWNQYNLSVISIFTLFQTFNNMASGISFAPDNLLKRIWADLEMPRHVHQDAQEFFIAFTSNIDEELLQIGSNAFRESFEAIMTTRKMCKGCNSTSSTSEAFDLQLAVPWMICTLSECIEKSCKPSQMSGIDCDIRNKRSDAVLTPSYASVPKILAMSFKAYRGDENSRWVKIFQKY